MKKSFICSFMALGMALSASAQSNGLKILSIDEQEEGMPAQLMGLAISANGKYVAGTTMVGGSFVYEMETGRYAYISSQASELRHVDNNGTGVGYDNYIPVTLGIDGTKTTLEAGGDGGIAEATTPDGSIVCGSGDWKDFYNTHACIWKDGVKTSLPEPTNKWLGFTNNGTSAKYINGDGTVIVGHIIDDMASNPVLVWHMNMDSTTYSADPICRRYFEQSDGTKPYWLFTATGISNNGKWLALTVQKNGKWNALMARYDLENDSLYVCDDTDLSVYDSYYSTAIADDGTIIGYCESGMTQTRTSLIWKVGEGEQPKPFTEEWPNVAEFTKFDTDGFNVPCGITPDGDCIMGFAVDGATWGYNTYVFKISDYATGISSVKDDNSALNAKTAARYTVDGKRVIKPVKGINIVRKANGRTYKELVK